ncbi:MAG TPA: GNAT family N-acetyltransferase [Luteolibacter sp.]|nr:GNAT family N-acetyltransferase [Luteolibacter sp.]
MDRYLRETARGHLEKGVSVTRVLVGTDAVAPKTVLGYFTLSSITVEAREWPGAPKGLPRQTVSAVLLGRLAVAQSAHGKGIGSMLVATARQLARETIARTGGVGLVVDAANEEIVGFYARFGFRRVVPGGFRMFLPAASLEGGSNIPLG